MGVRKRNRILAVFGMVSLLLTAILCNVPRAQAATKVDMTQKGTLSLELPGGDMVQDMVRLKGSDGTANGELRVHAWKVADMQETGKYKLAEAFKSLGIADDQWSEMSVSEEGWRNLSEAAMKLLYDLDEKENPVGEPKIAATYDQVLHVVKDAGGNAIIEEANTFTGMDLGLYLIVIDSAQSPQYTYTFTPMIVSLPWSQYQYDGVSGDTWEYERTVVLKPARELRYGSIEIVKELTEYNATKGDVTFVFDVGAKESAEPNAEIVYSNVVSLTFSAVGTQTARLDHIPAESVVTVTEVYTGANCELTEFERDSKVVIAEGEDGNPITFSFKNEYDEDAKSGYGVENRFRYNTETNTYQWTTDRPGMGNDSEGAGGAGTENNGGTGAGTDNGTTGGTDTNPETAE